MPIRHSAVRPICSALAVACAAAGAAPAAETIMPMGDSITAGVDYHTHAAGGYRDPLRADLRAAGIAFHFVGATTTNASPALTDGGDDHHNGYGFYRVDNLLDNLDGNAQPNPGDGNAGGWWLSGGHGSGRAAVSPDIVLLQIGTNDVLQHFDRQTANATDALFVADLEGRLGTLVDAIHRLSPHTVVLVAAIPPIAQAASLEAEIAQYDAWIRATLVPARDYTRFVDNHGPFLQADGSVDPALLGADHIHPNRYGYAAIALQFARAIEEVAGARVAGHALTVQGGTGGGTYPAGTVVPIRAGEGAAGEKAFAGWAPATDALYNAFAPVTLVTMPAADATVAARTGAAGGPLVPDGTYAISSYFDGLAMAATGTDAGAAVQQLAGDGPGRRWTVTNLGGNVVELAIAGSGNALQAAGGATAAGTALEIAPYTGAAAQKWTVTPAPDTFALVNAATGLAVTVNGYSTAPGAPLVQFTANCPVIQAWRFMPVADAAGGHPGP
jgi:lysophospholipase L1-like esterase